MEILLVIMVVTIIKFFHFINTNKEEKEMEIELAQEKRIAKLKADKEAEIAKYEAEVAEHAKHTTEKILDINTYQNNNLTNDDIMSTFKSQSLLYLKKYKYYFYKYEVYQNNERQNYAWHIRTEKHGHYIWSYELNGDILYLWKYYYTITFFYSNGFFELLVSNHKFDNSNISLDSYFATVNDLEIDDALGVCRQEAFVTWKKNGKQPKYMGEPFSFYALYDSKNWQSEYESYFRGSNTKSNSKQSTGNTANDISQLLKMFNVEYPGTDLELVNNHHQRWWLEWVAPIRGLKPSIILSFSTYS